MRARLALCALLVLAACSEEDATPIDLDGTAVSTTAPAAPGSAEGALPPTPHAIGESPQARAYAEQQCRDDPEAVQGIVRIVDPATNDVVGEVVVDCAEVRDGGGATGPGDAPTTTSTTTSAD